MPRTVLPFLALCVLAGCSGSSFDVVSTDDSGPDGAGDVATETEAAPPDAADSALPDADALVPPDTADAGPVDGTPDAADACKPNECGGCTPLTGKVGDDCGTCGGKLACKGTDALECSGSKPKNECGGCTTLTKAVGTVCGVCSGAKYVCDGTEATKCVDPVTTPAPGTSCGSCGTLKYACALDGKSTSCPGDDLNKCGGCGFLAGDPGTACGTTGACNGWVCATDKKSVVCTPPTTPVGTACGICGTSTYACTAPGSTSCAKPDDTVTGLDSLYTASSGTMLGSLPTSGGFDLSFKTLHKESIVSVKLVAVSTLVDGTKAKGTFEVRLFKGLPDGSLGGPVLLDTVLVDPTTLPTTVTPTVVTLTAPTALIDKDTYLFVDLYDNSPAYNFTLFGGAGPGIGDLKLWIAGIGSPTPAPYLEIAGKGCY